MLEVDFRHEAFEVKELVYSIPFATAGRTVRSREAAGARSGK